MGAKPEIIWKTKIGMNNRLYFAFNYDNINKTSKILRIRVVPVESIFSEPKLV